MDSKLKIVRESMTSEDNAAYPSKPKEEQKEPTTSASTQNPSVTALAAASHMNLNAEPASQAAVALTDKLATTIVTGEAGKASRPGAKFKIALGALLADLMRAALRDPNAYSYRSMASGSFSDYRIGYHVFRRARDGLKAEGLLEIVEGFGGGNLKPQATRFRATRKLLELAESHGLDPVDWSSHFRPLPRPRKIAQPLVLKSTKRMVRGKEISSPRIPFDPPTPKAVELAKRVEELNAFFANRGGPGNLDSGMSGSPA
jgi:hypothetical protein